MWYIYTIEHRSIVSKIMKFEGRWVDFEKLYWAQYCGLSTIYSFSPTVSKTESSKCVYDEQPQKLGKHRGQIERGTAGFRWHKIANEISGRWIKLERRMRVNTQGEGHPFGVLFPGEGHFSTSQFYSVVYSSLCRVEVSWAFPHTVLYSHCLHPCSAHNVVVILVRIQGWSFSHC